MTLKPCARNYYLSIALAVILSLIFIVIVISLAQPDVLEHEKEARSALLDAPINLHGVILDTNGTPVTGAIVSLQGQAMSTSPDGFFSLENITRMNRLLVIEAPGYRKEFIPVSLLLPISTTDVILDPVYLTGTAPGEVRFLFGGDTHFGRRYIDPNETTPPDRLPPDDPSAIIQVSDPGPGTRKVLHYIQPFFSEADFSSVNLESPVTVNLTDPNSEKKYILFTLPGSLPALREIGLSYVALGNNHVYDYLDPGLRDTLDNLNATGIAHSGAGFNATEAFSAYHVTLNNTSYAFLAMTSIDGAEHTINYVADDRKGGAANLKNTTMVRAAIANESRDGYVPVVQIHGGDEYTYSPPEFISTRMDLVTKAGAGLVITHHPHMAEGVGIVNGVVVMEGIGNLVFDAERHETKLGILARVDMRGGDVRTVRLIPFSIDNFTPIPVTGQMADLLIRRVGENSRNSLYPVYPYNGQGWVALGEQEYTLKERTIGLNVTVPGSGSTVLDLRQLARSSESLGRVKDSASGSTARLGRDLMISGDFEDWDTDDTPGETDAWDLVGNSSQLTVTKPFRGLSSLFTLREADKKDDSVITFRNRIRVTGDARNQTPNKNLTFLAYIHGQDAGNVRIIAKYLASEGEMAFGEEEILSIPGGSFPWQPYFADINMPADNPIMPRDPTRDPRAVQIVIRHSPSGKNPAIAEFDDLAIISWEDEVNLTNGAILKTPHARDFLRITGPPGTHQLTLTFQSYSPNFLESAPPLDYQDTRHSGGDCLMSAIQ